MLWLGIQLVYTLQTVRLYLLLIRGSFYSQSINQSIHSSLRGTRGEITGKQGPALLCVRRPLLSFFLFLIKKELRNMVLIRMAMDRKIR